jgi:hypothetical protein
MVWCDDDGGDIKYHGKPFFRGAIMNSGGIVLSESVNDPKERVVSQAGCTGSVDSRLSPERRL